MNEKQSSARGQWRRAAELLPVFLKIGAFTFGGGVSMIAMIERDIVEKKRLLDRDELMDIVAISESTPGPIAVNMATFVGYRHAGVPGALLSTVGVVLPSFLIILLVSLGLRQIADNRYVKYAFFGIRAGVFSLMVKVFLKFLRQTKKDAFALCVMAAAFLWSAVLGWSVIALLSLCGIIGVLYCWLFPGKGEKK